MWLKLGAFVVAIVAAFLTWFYVTRFFLLRLPDGAIGGTFSMFIGLAAAGIVYALFAVLLISRPR
jgi:hypothetical protein